MTCSLQQLSRAACASTTMVVLTSGAAAGPVMLIGDAADNHGPQNVYAGLLQEVLANTTNGQTGILALGVDFPSDAASWILDVSAQLPIPQLVAFANDETIEAIGFSGYGIIYIPSDAMNTAGGIIQVENDLLASRAGDLANFLEAGGGLFALTQGELNNPYAYLAEFAAVNAVAVPASGQCGGVELYDNVGPTALGVLFGLTETNLDGCCWHSVFATFPESLSVLAAADEPGCPDIDGKATILLGFLDLPEINFDPPDETLAVGEPNVEAVGDLDGEGTPDMVAVIPDEDPEVAGQIQVFLNQGVDPDGTWLGLMANEPITVGRNPSGVAVGLFNNDPHVDLAVINGNDDNVSIFFNTGMGDGTFVLASQVATGDQPSAIVASDFNEDTFVDLAVANAIEENVVLLFNDGDGNFAPAGSLGLGFGFAPTALFTGDFDDNKCPDLAGPGDGGGAGPAGSTGLVFVLLGQGGGMFGPPAFYTVGRNPSDISAGDLDGDGFLDIVTSDRDDDTVSVLINVGDGTFAPRFALAVGAMPSSVDVVDLNIDARPDVVVVADDLQIGPAIQVLENQQEANGADEVPFSNPTPFDVGADPNFVTSADFNVDGLPDLVTVNADDGGTGGSVSVLLAAPPPVGATFFLDISPGECPNPVEVDDDDETLMTLFGFHLSNGDLEVALGSEFIDVMEVDFSSILLSRADGVGGSIAPEDDDDFDGGPEFEDVATPFDGLPCGCHDLGGDGIIDLVMEFDDDDLVEVLELEDLPAGTEVELVLTYTLLGGTTHAARDCIVIEHDDDGPGQFLAALFFQFNM